MWDFFERVTYRKGKRRSIFFFVIRVFFYEEFIIGRQDTVFFLFRKTYLCFAGHDSVQIIKGLQQSRMVETFMGCACSARQ
ncbi:hypothetical protein MLD38_013823 [Melastoma candidum]|uniref:Uncharacterized protein n=1 Tax=Melastoma candidum TaxID=119954 RepID=A0ACB9REZ7_9MYRT|nr:hypothetical protein MLD38_013823 [Melastoma candidum]